MKIISFDYYYNDDTKNKKTTIIKYMMMLMENFPCVYGFTWRKRKLESVIQISNYTVRDNKVLMIFLWDVLVKWIFRNFSQGNQVAVCIEKYHNIFYFLSF